LLVALAACVLPGGNAPRLVKVGLVAPFSGGGYGEGYAALYAVKAAIAGANAAPEAGNVRFLLVANDDAGEPQGARAALEKLALDPEVAGAVALARDPTLAPLAAAAAGAGLPLVAFGSAAPYPPDANVFRLDAPPERVADRLLALAAAGGRRPVGLAWAPEEPYPVLAADLRTRAVARGVRLGVEAALPAGSHDGRGAAARLRETDVLYVGGPERGGQLLADLNAIGFSGEFVVAPPAATANFVKVAGTAAGGAQLLSLAPNLADAAERERFRAAYRGQIDADPAPVAAPAYDAANALLAALRRAGVGGAVRPDRAAVARALAATDVAGTTGRVRFGPDGGRLEAPLYLYRAIPGEFPGERIQ
jgi:branched-chain amino acid transport system substrate-binding protein